MENQSSENQPDKEEEILGKDFYEKNFPTENKEKPEEELSKTEDDEKSIKKQQDEFFTQDLIDAAAEREMTEVDPDDPNKIIKDNYLYSIFKPSVDKYGSYSYLRKIHKQKVKDGYAEGTTLNNFLFLSAVLRRYQIQYQQHHKTQTDNDVPLAENFDLMKKIETLSEKVSKISKVLDDQRNASRSGADIHDLHEKEIEENAKFVKAHIGEFSFRCKKCKNVVSAGGLPHWAYVMSLGEQCDPIYHVWSQELHYAYLQGKIPLHIMALALQTSIEGLKQTAEDRGEKMLEYDIFEEESKLKELMFEFEDQRS